MRAGAGASRATEKDGREARAGVRGGGQEKHNLTAALFVGDEENNRNLKKNGPAPRSLIPAWT
jgi:hypothetical protein